MYAQIAQRGTTSKKRIRFKALAVEIYAIDVQNYQTRENVNVLQEAFSLIYNNGL